MSTITRELAKLFRKITNSEIDAEGNAHVVLSPADSLLINNARIALASLEAEPVAWAHRLINKRNGVVHPCVYGSAELEAKCSALERLRTIVADPRALPRRKEWVGGQQYSYVLLENVEAMVDEACLAAMLQRSEPVTDNTNQQFESLDKSE